MKINEVFTLCFFINDTDVLLAMKKRGFGEGKWNGYGGKVDTKGGEAIKTAAVREIFEESKLTVDESKLEQVGLITFKFDKTPPEAFKCHIFIIREWKGDPIETEEMRPQWHSLDKMPFKEMWSSDRKYLPLVLSGQKIKAQIDFDSNGDKVNNFTWTKTKF